MPITIPPEWQQIAFYALGAALVLILLQRIPYVGRVVRFAFSLGLLALFGMTGAAWYHTLNGVRHLAWDAGYGYDIPSTYRSGHIVLVGTVVMTLLTWIIASIVWA